MMATTVVATDISTKSIRITITAKFEHKRRWCVSVTVQKGKKDLKYCATILNDPSFLFDFPFSFDLSHVVYFKAVKHTTLPPFPTLVVTAVSS